MVDRSLVERKFETSKALVNDLLAAKAQLLAAYWEWEQERDRWIFYLVPNSNDDERALVEATSKIMIEQPYRSVFSLSDVFVDAHQISGRSGATFAARRILDGSLIRRSPEANISKA